MRCHFFLDTVAVRFLTIKDMVFCGNELRVAPFFTCVEGISTMKRITDLFDRIDIPTGRKVNMVIATVSESRGSPGK